MSKDNKNIDNGWIGPVFIFYVIVCLALTLAALLTGCSPRIVEHVVEKEKVVYRDSVAWRDSILMVPIPLEKDHAIVSTKDTSRLCTTVAESVAFVDSTGRLHHSLENRKTSLAAPVKFPVHYIFNGVTYTKVETITNTVEVPAKLSWWQRFRLDAFWWLLGATVAALLWIFRKPILKAIGF